MYCKFMVSSINRLATIMGEIHVSLIHKDNTINLFAQNCNPVVHSYESDSRNPRTQFLDLVLVL